MLFDRLDVAKPCRGPHGRSDRAGAGGVGSIAIQLARALTDLTVIATAYRAPRRAQWCRDLGAHHVIDHARPLAAEVRGAWSPGAPGFVFSTTQTGAHLPSDHRTSRAPGAPRPDRRPETLDVMPLKPKSLSLHWELMFTRSLFQTADMERQHVILTEVARLVDAGQLRTTLSETFGPIQCRQSRTRSRAYRKREGEGQGRPLRVRRLSWQAASWLGARTRPAISPSLRCDACQFREAAAIGIGLTEALAPLPALPESVELLEPFVERRGDGPNFERRWPCRG